MNEIINLSIEVGNGNVNLKGNSTNASLVFKTERAVIDMTKQEVRELAGVLGRYLSIANKI